MSNNPRLTIVMPTYNQGPLIGQAIESVLAQSAAPALELIIMDAKSTDHTTEVVSGYRTEAEERLASFRFISETDHGQSDAFNKGIRLASGPLIGCLCSDDYFELQVLDRVLHWFDDHPQARWGYGGWRFVDYDRGVFRTVPAPRYRAARLRDYDPIGMPSCFFSKAFFLDVGGFREDLHLSMDYDLWLRMMHRSDPIVMPFIVANMRYYAQTKSGSRTFDHLKETFRVQRQHTRGVVTRLRQLFFYLSGWVVVALRRDLTRLVERNRQRRLSS